MAEETFTPDPPPTLDEHARVERLSEEELELIDTALLSNASYRWQKVEMVVVMTMENCASQIPSVPDLFYGQRGAHAGSKWSTLIGGHLSSMRFSEVKLPGRNITKPCSGGQQLEAWKQFPTDIEW